MNIMDKMKKSLLWTATLVVCLMMSACNNEPAKRSKEFPEFLVGLYGLNETELTDEMQTAGYAIKEREQLESERLKVVFVKNDYEVDCRLNSLVEEIWFEKRAEDISKTLVAWTKNALDMGFDCDADDYAAIQTTTDVYPYPSAESFINGLSGMSDEKIKQAGISLHKKDNRHLCMEISCQLAEITALSDVQRLYINVYGE